MQIKFIIKTVTHASNDPKGQPQEGAPDTRQADEVIRLLEANEVDRAGAIVRSDVFTVTDFSKLTVFLLEKGEVQNAYEILMFALSKNPDSAELLFNMGSLLSEVGEIHYAIEHLEKALQLDSALTNAYPILGYCYLRLEDAAKACEAFERAFQSGLSSPNMHMNYSTALLAKGDKETAARYSAMALGAEPADPAIRYNHVKFRTYRKGRPDDDRELADTQRLLSAPNLPNREASLLSFAGAKILDDMEEFDDAFHLYERGNSLVEVPPFDLTGVEMYYRRVKGTFDSAYFQRSRERGLQTEAPTFVIGMPRSGTSLVQQVLTKSDSVESAGEHNAIAFTQQKLIKMVGANYLPHMDRLPAELVQRLAREYLESLPQNCQGAEKFIDKMPTNFQLLGVILTLFPNAKIVHCVRDPKDTCASMYCANFLGNQGYSYDQRNVGKMYCLYADLMKHWHSVLPSEQLTAVAYEDMVQKPEPTAQRLYDFCGLEFDQSSLDFQNSKGHVWTASAVQVREPLYNTSIGRWKRFEKHLGPMLEELEKLN